MADVEELMASIKQYTKEDIKDLAAAKAQISKILKTHRPIKLIDYQYGFSFTGKKDHRLIVKEENDKTKVRMFSKQKSHWYCTNRRYKADICRNQYLKFKYGMVFASTQHSNECKTKDYSFVMEYQNLLKQGKFRDAREFKKRRGTLSLNETSNETSILNESNLSTMDMDNDTNLDQSIANDTNDSHDSNIIPSESEITTPTLVETDQEPSSSSVVKRELDDTEYSMTIVQPLAKKPKLESDYSETFSLEHPSTSVLKEICNKLGIEYNYNAYKFWSDIAFETIVQVSENIKTHSFKSSNFFACLTQFFTGKPNSCFIFQHTINTSFYDELIAEGIKSNADIDEICTNNTVTDEHLEFIAKFLSCRIGIFENGNLKKYGKWESENNDALTLILSVENGFYSVVTDL